MHRFVIGWVSVCVGGAVQAQVPAITVDPGAAGGRSVAARPVAARPVVDSSQGVPVIQIVPPSASGVSHNRFTHFNVGPAGVVLNNSGDTSQTQLAGQIAGNPLLGRQHATTILNQVTANNPSQLRGMLEVAGHRARVIVANPAGITCDGCGFLNVSRATLTTGRPEVGPKDHISLDVASGTLTIEGNGLNGTQAGQVDLLARALVINAQVWADHLNVIAGAARVDANRITTRPLRVKGRAPAIALDTAALGGMYANSIRLIGTEAGVGVNIGGDLVALTGALTLNTAGDVRILPNTTLFAKQKLALHAKGKIDTRQAVLHGTQLEISARALHNQRGSVTAAESATLRLRDELLNTGGVTASAAAQTVNAGRLNNRGGTVAGGTLSMSVKNDIDNRKGLILADKTLTLSAASLSNDETLLPSTATDATAGGRPLSGAATPSGTAAVDAGRGVDAVNASTGNASVVNASVVNASTGAAPRVNVSAVNASTVVAAGTPVPIDGTHPISIDGTGPTGTGDAGPRDTGGTGPIGTGRTAPISTGVSGKIVDIRAGKVSNTRGSIRATFDLMLASDTLKNPSGRIESQRNANIDVQILHNKHGLLAAANKLTVQAKSLGGLGRLQSGVDLAFTYEGSLAPHGNFVAARDLTLHLGGALTNPKRLAAGRDLTIKATSLSNAATGALLGGRRMTIEVREHATNAGVIDGRITRVNAANLHNRGRIYGDSVAIGVGSLLNDSASKKPARISARGDLNMGVGALVNRHHGVLYAKKNLRVGALWHATKGGTGQADTLDNIGARIEAGGAVTIAAGQIRNLNADFATETVRVSAKPKVYFSPEGSTEMYDAAGYWLCDLVTPGCSRRPEWLDDDPERRLLKQSKKYAESRYGPPFDYAPRGRGFAGVSSPIALSYTPPGRQCIARNCRETTERFRYPRDAKIWAVFGVQPPADLPDWRIYRQAGARRFLTPEQQRKVFENSPAYKEHKARHVALDARIKAFNRDFQSRLVKHFTFYEVTESVTQTRTLRSDPARIFAGGAMHLKGAVVNDKSLIAAGGKLRVEGPRINNIGATGWRTVTREGQATFTQARRSDRKAHRWPYKVTAATEPINLPVGAIRPVMVSQDQVPAHLDTSQMSSTLMLGRSTQISSQGDVTNSGTIGGFDKVEINALNIINHSGGRIQAQRVELAARENLNIVAARVLGHTVALRARHDINLMSVVAFENHGSTWGSHLSGVSQVSASDLSMRAENDINMLAAKVSAEHNAQFQAGRDIRLQELTVEHHESTSRGRHHRHEKHTKKVVGSSARAKGDLSMEIGQDLDARAVQIETGQNLAVKARRHVKIQAGIDSGAAFDKFREKKKKLLSSKTTETTASIQWQEAHASTVAGKNVEIAAGGDVTVQGSNAVAQQHLNISAEGNVNIEPGRRKNDRRRTEKTKKSGIGATGGISVGSNEQKYALQDERQGTVASVLGSAKGNITIQSGQSTNVTGSTIIAPEGDIALTGQQVNIDASHDTQHIKESLQSKQTGVGISVETPMLSILQLAEHMVDTQAQSDDPMMQGLAAATAGRQLIHAVAALKESAAATDAQSLEKIGGVSVSIKVGKSKQSSTTERTASTVAGSTIAAGKRLSVAAKGAGKSSNINVKGSTLSAVGDAHLKAEGNVNLQASDNVVHIKHKHSSSSAAVGVGVSFGSKGVSVGVTADAAKAKGKARGRDRTMTNTKVSAGQKLIIESGADTEFKGAVVSGKQVVVDVGGNLNIESVQDTSTFESTEQRIGGSVTVGAGVAGSASYARNKVKGDFANVEEFSGIQAGDDGFDVRVKGHTNLKGATIASTEHAVQSDANRLSTGTLAVSDIENHSDYRAHGMAVSGGVSVDAGNKKTVDRDKGKTGQTAEPAAATVIGADTQAAKTQATKNQAAKSQAGQNKAQTVARSSGDKRTRQTSSSGAVNSGVSRASGQARSTTKSGISGARVTLTDHEKQRLLTGETASQLLATLNQDGRVGDAASDLSKTWDPEQLRAKIAVEAEIVAAFNQQATQAIRSYADEKRSALRQQIKEPTDEHQKRALQQQLSELDTQERIMNAVVGAMTGSADVAALQAGLSEAAGRMRDYTTADSQKFAGITDGITTLDNKGGESQGIRGDGVKNAGVRISLDVLCGTMNQHCKTQVDADKNPILDERGIPKLLLNPQGLVQFDRKASGPSLAEFLQQSEGKVLSGFTGGIQGREGTLGGYAYRVGGVLDLAHEAYAGPHDFIGGTVSGLYDKQGNARRGLTSAEKAAYEVWSAVALVPATPFAWSEMLPPEAWQALDVLLQSKK